MNKRVAKVAPTPEHVFAQELLKALYGKTVDVDFMGEMLVSADALDKLASAKKLGKKELKSLESHVIGTPAKVFEAPDLADEGDTKENRQAAIEEYKRQIAAERRYAENDKKADRTERMPEQRLSFLAMADRLMGMGEPQRAFEFLESARTIRMRIGVVDSRESLLSESDLTRQIAAEKRAAEDDRKKKLKRRKPGQRLTHLKKAEKQLVAGDLTAAEAALEEAKKIRKKLSRADAAVDNLADPEGVGWLDHLFRDAQARASALVKRSRGLEEFATKQSAYAKKKEGSKAKGKHTKDVGKGALAKLGKVQREISMLTVSLSVTDNIENTPDNRKNLDGVEQKIQAYTDALDEIEAPLRDWYKNMSSHGVKLMKEYIKTEDGQLQRSGGDETGGGEAKGRSKTAGVPQEYLDRLTVTVDLHQRFIDSGDLDWDHFTALETIGREADRDLEHLREHLVNYQRCDHFLKMARERLGQDHYSYLVALRDSWIAKVDDYEKLISTDPEKAHELLDALTADLAKGEIDKPFKDAEADFESLQKLYDKIKKKLTKDYATVLYRVVVEYEAALSDNPEIRLTRSFKNVIRGRESYKGKYHDQLEEHWRDADFGSNEGRKALRGKLEQLLEQIKREVTTLEGLQGKANAGGSRADRDQRAFLLARAITDLDQSEKEIADRSTLEKKYKKIFDAAQAEIDQYSFRLLAFWKRFGKKDRRLDKGVGDALSNHRTLLKALESRSKATKTVQQWEDLIADAEKKQAQIERFIEANSIPREDGKPANDQNEAAVALSRCGREIDEFCTNIKDFAKKVENNRGALQAIVQKNASDSRDAATAVGLIDNEIDKVKKFADVFVKGFENHGFKKLAMDINKASPAEVMKLRETAVAALRRYRTHLTDSQLGRLYASNPFDEGAEAVPLRLEMIRAEGMLNTKIKPS